MILFKLFLLAMINSLCNTLANALWKYQFSRQALDVSSMGKLIKTCFQLNIFLGVFFYVVSMLTFFYLLSNYKISSVIPLLAMNYIFNLLAAYILFKDTISITQIVGMAIILLGIVIYSRGINQL